MSTPTSGPEALALLVQEPQEHRELVGSWVQHGLKRQVGKAAILARFIRTELKQIHV